MKRRLLYFLGISILLRSSPVFAEESLAEWASSLNATETQYKILQRIYPNTLGPPTSAVLDPYHVTSLFPKDDAWVQLTREFVWMPAETPGSQPALFVTCLSRKKIDVPPDIATSYLFRDLSQKPSPISSGYGNREHVKQVTPPKLNQTFLTVETLAVTPQGKVTRETATIYQVNLAQTGNPLHSVWVSRPSARYFHLGFATLHDSGGENLVIKESPPPTPKSGEGSGLSDLWGDSSELRTPRYSTYRWSDGRFVEDDNIFPNQLKDLPESTWR